MKRKIIIGSLAVLVGLAAFFYWKSKQHPVAQGINPAFSEYITSYTAGTIPSGAAIRVELASAVADTSMVGNEVASKLFSFSPSLTGKTYWVDERTVEFRPEQRMPNGQVYEATFLLSRISKVSGELSEFVFGFQVRPQNFTLLVENIKPYVKTELARQRIEGKLHTADFASQEAVEQILSANQDGKTLNVSWTHNTDGLDHNFVVEDVTRRDKGSEVVISLSGKALGIERDSEERVEIPALGDFKLMNTRVVQSPSQYVVLQFSDPLLEKQDLTGFITVEDSPGLTFEYEIQDNEVRVYPSSRLTGTKRINIVGIRNIKNYKIPKQEVAEVLFEQEKPAVRFLASGSILPSTEGLVLPFEAVNLKSVNVSVTQVFENNILQFLQVNKLDGTYEMARVARPMFTKTISLENSGVTDLGRWNRFSFDLSSMIQAAPGNIYQIRISFKQENATYNCEGEPSATNESANDSDGEEYYGQWVYDEETGESYYMEGYDYRQRENPCHLSYYAYGRSITKNILGSDLGLIAKQGTDGEVQVFVSDLKTTEPQSGVEVEFYDYSQQLLSNVSTSSDGKVSFKGEDKPFAVIAKKGTQRGYLRLNDGESVSMSGFDVAGESLSKGLKGMLYGDRGVWRPGDSLFLSFILEDKSKTLPPSHPVVFELQNPKNQVVTRLVRSASENGFYNFATATAPDAPTGNWLARVKVGGAEFSQTVKIETVKPNRLKIGYDFAIDKFTSPDITGNMIVNWLHGAVGKGLNVNLEYSVVPAPTQFKTFPDYTFVDNAWITDRDARYQPELTKAFEGVTDESGKAPFAMNLNENNTNPWPGFMNVVLRGRATEPSGNFSIDRVSVPFYPYSTYVGYYLPGKEQYYGMLHTGVDQKVEIATVNTDGFAVSRKNVTVKLYSLERYWWWDYYYYSSGSRSIADYIESSSTALIKEETISTVQGKATWTFKREADEYGSYYIKITDAEGHSTGGTFYMDAPGYYGRNSRENKTGATKLVFNAEKPAYSVGEEIKVVIPAGDAGRALISIENGRKVLASDWLETKKGENIYQFKATPEMAPNIYVHVSLLQPHAQTANSLPIRLYGVVPVGVENPETHLSPEIKMPDVLEPGSPVKIQVTEKAKRKMTFTLAVVDEGLLDLTRFKTPEPWKKFYAREALGVRTWDLYDQVMGAYGSKIERLLALGGSDEGAGKDSDPRANRFKPVVKFFGPITLDAGETETIAFTMPQYIGSVKTMLVAGYEGAYGHAEKVTPVRKPLMVLATLPRVLGPEEKVKLPITLFAADKSIKSVRVEVKTEGPLVISETVKTITMPSGGDFTFDFDVDVKSEIGIGKVKVVATSGSFKGEDAIEIEVRNPNQPVTQVAGAVVEAGKSWNTNLTPFGMAGTNSALLEVSTIPPINLGYRLQYLIQYPHGCIEQTTSAAFPQLYLDVVQDLSDNQKSKIKSNINAAVSKLKKFQTGDGGFSYWPGYGNSDDWGSTYAGHFLVEAERKGYFVPQELLTKWKQYQKSMANGWRAKNYEYSDQAQAYRLYALALAGAAEIPAMNRLRESGKLTLQAKWLLAAAYARAGQLEVAKTITSGLSTAIGPYIETGYNYGSDIRDLAMILEVLTLLNERTKGFEIVQSLSKALSNYDYWMSTQATAFSLKSIGVYLENEKAGSLNFDYTVNGASANVKSQRAVSQVAIPSIGTKPMAVGFVNRSGGSLFVRSILTGTPARGTEAAQSNGMTISVEYIKKKGGLIDITKLEAGTQFEARITVSSIDYRSTYRNIALTQVFPSGWEITNTRLHDEQPKTESGEQDEDYSYYSRPDYQDIRDDRVYSYFDLDFKYNGGNYKYEKTFVIPLTASFVGSFYLPAIRCEAMYNNKISATNTGQTVEVYKPATQ